MAKIIDRDGGSGYTESEIRQFAARPKLITSQAPTGNASPPNIVIDGNTYLKALTQSLKVQAKSTGYRPYMEIDSQLSGNELDLLKWAPANRVCGVILATNPDGSQKVAILSNTSEHFNLSTSTPNVHFAHVIQNIHCWGQYSTPSDLPNILPYNDHTSGYMDGTIREIYSGTSDRIIDQADIHDYDFYFQTNGYAYNYGTLYHTGSQGNVLFETDSSIHNNITLTNDPETTLVLGNLNPTNAYFRYGGFNGNSIVGKLGDVYRYLQSRWSELKNYTLTLTNVTSDYEWYYYPENTDYFATLNHSFDIRYFNLILTNSLSYARNYLENDVIPPDATIYPWDFDNPPKYTSDDEPGVTPDDDDDTDEPGENGDDERDTTPTPLTDPLRTPAEISNLNMYWLTSAQFESFITWFWNNAGDILDVGTLWDRLKGLYGNLSETIVNVKFMPIFGSEPALLTPENIKLGMIQTPNTLQAPRINGIMKHFSLQMNIRIDEHYHSFCDYPPYTSMYLWLPLYGFYDIDAAIFMDHSLKLYLTWDILAGTLTYYIFCDDYMVDTVTAKASIDIPVSLMSATDYSDTVRSNITRIATSLIGTGVSAVSGNPIGVTMGLSNIANSQTQGMPFSVKGNVSDAGMLFAPDKVALYIRQPSYNRPKNYSHHVGYPCNKQYKLAQLSGFTTCFQPEVDFLDDPKPTKEEIEEITAYLEGGIYI